MLINLVDLDTINNVTKVIEIKTPISLQSQNLCYHAFRYQHPIPSKTWSWRKNSNKNWSECKVGRRHRKTVSRKSAIYIITCIQGSRIVNRKVIDHGKGDDDDDNAS